MIPYFVCPRFACWIPKIQKCYFLSIGLWEHPEWHSATRSNTRAPKVHFSTKMTKMPPINLGLTKGQIRLKSSQNNIFHGFTSNPSFSEIFGKFDQVWLSLTRSWPRMALKTLILIQQSKRVGTNVIAKIIKFSFQRLFMGWNWSQNGQDITKAGITHWSMHC